MSKTATFVNIKGGISNEKTWKRALSLALASVMLLGMMVVPALRALTTSATRPRSSTRTPWRSPSAIGLFDGWRGRVLRPQERSHPRRDGGYHQHHAVWRGVNVNQFAETSVFTDVPAWRRGYVNLCSSPSWPAWAAKVRPQRRNHRAGRADAVPRPGLLPERR